MHTQALNSTRSHIKFDSIDGGSNESGKGISLTSRNQAKNQKKSSKGREQTGARRDLSFAKLIKKIQSSA